MSRFIFNAGRAHYSLAGAPPVVKEIWIGVEIEGPIDIEEFSRETGYDLVSAQGMSEEELRSVGVSGFRVMRV